ncbi:MAG: hypothetical protein ACFE0Q_00535 [Anaerolineae bacterium]
MVKRLLLFIALFVLALPLYAQDAETPQVAIESALSAVEAQVGERANNYTFEFLGETTDSSLGCGLVTGEELPFVVNAVRVNVIYPDAQYAVFVSINGQRVILCDSQFGEEVLSAQVDDTNACTVTPIAPLPAYIAPNITLNGVFTATTEPYRVYGASGDGGWYQIVGDAGLGWVEATSVTLNGDCEDVPTTALTTITDGAVCFVSALGGFSNVRTVPEGELVARIYQNETYQATARDSAGTWFYVQPLGWISNTVLTLTGACEDLPVNDNAVGIGFVDDLGTLDGTDDVTEVLARFRCPADFAGYLIPRISIGTANAQVQAGAVPNALRGYPSVDDNEGVRLGVIQPARTIDRVIAGPACNQGFVWWLVEIDDVIGWTAESNESSDDYYLIPTGDTPPAQDNTAPDAPAPTLDGNLETLDMSDAPIDALVFTADSTRLFALTREQGFGDATRAVVLVYDLQTGAPLARIEEPAGISALAYASEADQVLVVNNNGTITLYDAQTLTQTTQLSEQLTSVEALQLALYPDASRVVFSTCVDASCQTSSIGTVTLADGTISNTQTVDSAASDLVLSVDTSTLALLTAEGVRFYNAETLEQISTWENSDGFPLDSVALTTDGESALVAGCNNLTCDQGRIGLVNVSDGALLGVVPSHETSATRITYRPDDQRFITVGEPSSVLIERNASTGNETQQFTVGGEQVVTSLAYAPDGSLVAVGTDQGQVFFFPLTD